MFKYLAFNVKATTDDERGVTVFRTVGNPYGGPEFLGNRDFDGEAFTKNTDFGRNADGSLRVQTVFAYYDHALGKMKDLIGVAKFVEDSEEGLVWDIEVEKANRYHDMMVAMAEKKLLGSSSQPIQTSVKINKKSGEIERWHNAEISFTPTPSNPNAVLEVMKSFNIDDAEIAIYKSFAESVEQQEDATETGEDAQGTDETGAENADTPNADFGDEIDDLFSPENDDTEEDAVPSIEGLEDVQKTLNDISEVIASLVSEVTALKSQSVENREGIDAVMESVQGVRKGVKSFAENVARELRFKVKELSEEDANLSDDEREANKESRKRFTMPDYAPGKGRN